MTRRITLQAHVEAVSARRREQEITAPLACPVNNGSRRTREKRSLLAVIADNARSNGREPAFSANF